MSVDVPDSAIPDELDQAILHALQLSPRVGWARVAQVLSIDASTAARRWRRMERAGTAWVTCQPPREPDTHFALVEIACEHGRRAEVIRAVSAEACCFTVDVTSGSRDLMVLVGARTYEALTSYVIDRFESVPHIRSTRTHVAVRLFTDGSRWRLASLDSSQVGLFRRGRAVRPAAPWSALDDADWTMAMELGRDGRAPVAKLAEVCGSTESTARRRLERLLANGQLTLRTESARPVGRHRMEALFFADAAVGQLDHRVALLTRHSEIRAVFSSVDAYTLGFVVRVDSLQHLLRFEKQITAALGLTIRDRILLMRTVKRVGRMLDPLGRSLEHVPADLRDADPYANPCAQAPGLT